jgi:CRP-like cAMP-binding protein
MQDLFLTPDKKRKNLDIIEAKIFQLAHQIKKELEAGIDLGDIILKKVGKEDLGKLVQQIIEKGKFFTKVNVDVIKYFLNKYTKYGNFEGDKEFLLTKLSLSMHVETFPKDFLLFRKNDIGDKFFIILNGSVAIIITQEINVEMTEKEYNIHVEKLRYYKEYQLLESILAYDNKIEIYDELKEKIKDEIHMKFLKNRDLSKSQPSEKIIINAQAFVERVEPFINTKSRAPRISVRLPIYKIVANLKAGATFGEVALSKTEVEERKRTATIITDSDCIFGIIPNTVYSTFLKEVEEKARFYLASKLVSHSLFKSIQPESFLKANFLNYFNNMTFKGGAYLFKQGETKQSVFFVNDGIINLYTVSSIDNIVKIIERLNENVIQEIKNEHNKYIRNKFKEQEEDLSIIKEYENQKRTDNLFNKFCKIERTFKIFNINKKESLGFDDCLLSDDKFFISARVMSETCHVFVLKLNFLNSILGEKIISRNYARTNIEKKKIMINRLTNMIRMLIVRFLKNNKISISKDDYLEEKKKVEINILKSENISFKNFQKENEKFSLTRYGYKNPIQNFKTKRKHNTKFINLMKPKSKFDLDKFLFNNKMEREKYKSIKKEKVKFNNRLLNIHINFSNDNLTNRKKFKLPFMDKIKSLHKNKEKKDKYQEEKCKTEINSENYINNLIPNIKKLSTKYMIDEYKYGKHRIKNMTQLDFVFFDHFFVSQGKKNYSKEPMETNY